MDKVHERVLAWLVGSIAGAMLSAGVAVLLAGVSLFAMLSEPSALGAIAAIVLQLGVAFVIAGAAARYLSRRRGVLLPNERVTTPDDQRQPVGGWLVAFGFALAAVPLGLLVQLRPFLMEWRRVLDFLATPGMWDNANANMSGVVLLPLAAALTPPFFELATMIGFVATSAMLLPLMLTRSPQFPRMYVACVVLLSGLIFASVRGTDGAMLAGDALRDLIATTSVNAQEDAVLRQGLERYTSIVGSTAPALLWAFCAYVMWLPVMFSSERVPRTFALRMASPAEAAAKAADVASITNPPRFPGAGF
jgi:hypothetical protein